MATYLDSILAAHRKRASADTRKLSDLVAQTEQLAEPRGFRSSLRAQSASDSPRLGVIAEIKRRSPSKGDLFAGLDPVEVARSYERGGAAALSVLTDVDHFGGSPSDLQAARASISLPVIRKDFTVSLNDVCDARLMGADCVLLIVAALTDTELLDFSSLAFDLGLDALVECHDEDEVQRCLQHTRGDLVGINQRDLVTFKVDTDRALSVVEHIPPLALRVAESGVSGPEAAQALADGGYDAVLVGEHLVTSGDPEAATDALRVSKKH